MYCSASTFRIDCIFPIVRYFLDSGFILFRKLFSVVNLQIRPPGFLNLSCKGGLLPEIVLLFFGSDVHPIFLSREACITVSALLLLPMCFLKKFENFKFTRFFVSLLFFKQASFLGLGAIGYNVFIVLYYYCTGVGGGFQIELARFDVGSLQVLAIPVCAYICHTAVCLSYFFCLIVVKILEVYGDLPGFNRPKKACVISSFAMIIVIMLNCIFGVFGYLTWGPAAEPNIFNNCNNN